MKLNFPYGNSKAPDLLKTWHSVNKMIDFIKHVAKFNEIKVGAYQNDKIVLTFNHQLHGTDLSLLGSWTK